MRYLLAMLLMALGSSAQAAEAGDRYWVEPGVTIGNPIFGAYIDGRYGHGDYLFAVGVASQTEWDEEDSDYGARSVYGLVGKTFDMGGLNIVAQTGISSVDLDYGNTESDAEKNGQTIGIPVRFTKYFGGSTVGFALSLGFTWTDKESFGYVGFGLPIGKLK